MKVKFFVQRCLFFINRFKIDTLLLLLCSLFFLYQSIASLQKEQSLTKERNDIKKRVDDNFKKVNLFKTKADTLLAEQEKVDKESRSCLAKKKLLPNECEKFLYKSVALQNELKLMLEQVQKAAKEVEKDNCFLYPDLKGCPNSTKKVK
jgi:chromosome segregation ATPase